MQSLAFKMLFRRKGTVSTILAIALLIALLASVTSLMNNISSQTLALSQLAGVGRNYLIIDETASSLIDSQLDAELVDVVRRVEGVNVVVAQTLLPATLTSDSGEYAVTVRGVSDVGDFCSLKRASVHGSRAVNESQINVGRLLYQYASLAVGDTVSLTVGGKTFTVNVSGTLTSSSQSESEIIVPLSSALMLSRVSFIEFTTSSSAPAVLNRLDEVLPADVQVCKVQQVDSFALDVNSQILSFLTLWSGVIYVVVIAASYVVASRLISEASYELSMLKTLGAKRRALFGLVFSHTLLVAFVGAGFGLALGVVGAQLASTGLRWISTAMQLTPFLELSQLVQIFGLALLASVFGAVIPALKAAFKPSVETNI